MKRKSSTALISSAIMIGLALLPAVSGCSSEASDSSRAGRASSASFLPHDQQSGSGSHTAKGEAGLTKIYSLAIGDFIRLVRKEYRLSFDTLFFGRHVYGQPDDFPDIELPATIESTNVRLVSPEQGKKVQNERKSSFYVNLIGWVDREKAEFTFVTFSNGYAHQFDCFLSYKYDPHRQVFNLEHSRFEDFLYKAK